MGIVKMIGRTLVFLLAAVIVLAGVNALDSAGVLSSVPGGPEGGFQLNSAAQTSTDAVANTAATSSTDSSTAMTRPNFERGEGDHESEGFSLMGLTMVAKNLGQMCIIIAVVALLTRFIKMVGKRRTAQESA